MFYYLYSELNINLFQYITVRAGFGFFISFMLTLLLLPRFIRWARSFDASQPISRFAPLNHQSKANTPTMGGVVFVGATLVASLLAARLDNLYVILGMAVLLLFSLLGVKDDFAKIAKKSNAGITSAKKLFFQITFALVVGFSLMISGFDSEFYIPFYKFPLFDMGFFSAFFWAVVMIAASNAVNITDGLDGLATVPSIFSLLSLAIFTYITGNAVISGYLLMPKFIEAGELSIMALSLIGGLLGFLWYNCNPAQVFMGDSGSLAIGAFLGYLAVMAKSEILLLIIGFLFVLETVSVILQIGSYKTRGKKVFLMAPIHHHFEIKGWAENKITVRFWIIALMSNLIALISIKLR